MQLANSKDKPSRLRRNHVVGRNQRLDGQGPLKSMVQLSMNWIARSLLTLWSSLQIYPHFHIRGDLQGTTFLHPVFSVALCRQFCTIQDGVLHSPSDLLLLSSIRVASSFDCRTPVLTLSEHSVAYVVVTALWCGDDILRRRKEDWLEVHLDLEFKLLLQNNHDDIPTKHVSLT